ncbi:esterase [Agaricicola taiwanensis]|uniref:Esterase n=2 Tax=Agaricicola taiwanensis TaxID=591372 RepID=A0A8J2VK83_9RHOB|nr:esterase [Agaricicola taiwanensis]
MAIGEFGGSGETEFGLYGTLPLYMMYEASHAALNPARTMAEATKLYFRNPINPWSHTALGRSWAAAAEVFERTTRRYGKPSFDLPTTLSHGRSVPITERIVWSRPFCKLIHFEKSWGGDSHRQPKLLIVAPMSGHFATLLRGTVEAMLPDHDVYITDWTDARLVPTAEGEFTLDDYIDYVISILHKLGPDTHVMAVCQPAVPVFAAVARMEEDRDPYAPRSMILMGGPIDTRENPTGVNDLAEERGIDWFRRNVITTVPFPHPGFMRPVYPGFLQLTGFVSMNLDRHMSAHRDFFHHLVANDGDSAEKHRDFYDEYLAVMDLTAEFYLQTVDAVFIKHALPKGEMTHRGRLIRPEAITSTALMTIEGENDDISGVGQTRAAHKLCSRLAPEKKVHWLQPKVGHYGVFNGSRFRSEIVPRITQFILSNEGARPTAKVVKLAGAKSRIKGGGA